MFNFPSVSKVCFTLTCRPTVYVVARSTYIVTAEHCRPCASSRPLLAYAFRRPWFWLDFWNQMPRTKSCARQYRAANSNWKATRTAANLPWTIELSLSAMNHCCRTWPARTTDCRRWHRWQHRQGQLTQSRSKSRPIHLHPPSNKGALTTQSQEAQVGRVQSGHAPLWQQEAEDHTKLTSGDLTVHLTWHEHAKVGTMKK